MFKLFADAYYYDVEILVSSFIILVEKRNTFDKY